MDLEMKLALVLGAGAGIGIAHGPGNDIGIGNGHGNGVANDNGNCGHANLEYVTKFLQPRRQQHEGRVNFLGTLPDRTRKATTDPGILLHTLRERMHQFKTFKNR
jgi:hypothetical protein